MLKLTYANRTEDLLEALAKSLEDERQKHTIWQPIQLVVPNPNVKRYLLDGLGRRLGVLANYKVNYLDGLWRSALEQMDPPFASGTAMCSRVRSCPCSQIRKPWTPRIWPP